MAVAYSLRERCFSRESVLKGLAVSAGPDHHQQLDCGQDIHPAHRHIHREEHGHRPHSSYGACQAQAHDAVHKIPKRAPGKSLTLIFTRRLTISNSQNVHASQSPAPERCVTLGLLHMMLVLLLVPDICICRSRGTWSRTARSWTHLYSMANGTRSCMLA